MPQEPSLMDLFPPLEETSHSRESLIEALRNEVTLPSPEVAVATWYVEDIEQDILDVLARACGAELDDGDSRLLFRGLHILGGRRRPAGFPALIAFLRGPLERVEDVFAETVTDKSVQAIVAGMFNGDVDLLMGLIADREIDPFVRDAAMRAFICLVIDGRIERQLAADFLQRFDAERMAPPGDVTWNSWMVASRSYSRSERILTGCWRQPCGSRMTPNCWMSTMSATSRMCSQRCRNIRGATRTISPTMTTTYSSATHTRDLAMTMTLDRGGRPPHGVPTSSRSRCATRSGTSDATTRAPAAAARSSRSVA
jgi:hypothetical protein